MLENPVITRLLRYGTAQNPRRAAFCCTLCGCGLEEGEVYYRLAGAAYCQCCVEDSRKEVIG